MENFKLFGNPDGPQLVPLFAFKSFIKDKERSRSTGKMQYKPVMLRSADLQIQALIVVALLALPYGMWTLLESPWLFGDEPPAAPAPAASDRRPPRRR